MDTAKTRPDCCSSATHTQNIARVRNCPDVPILNSLFGLCLVVVFVVVVFVVVVFVVVVLVVVV